VNDNGVKITRKKTAPKPTDQMRSVRVQKDPTSGGSPSVEVELVRNYFDPRRTRTQKSTRGRASATGERSVMSPVMKSRSENTSLGNRDPSSFISRHPWNKSGSVRLETEHRRKEL